MSETILRPLTASEAELYEALTSGSSRSEFARQKGVTKPAITQMIASLNRKGYSVPDPIPKESPRFELAKALFREGLDNKQVAEKMEISFSRACLYRRKCRDEA